MHRLAFVSVVALALGGSTASTNCTYASYDGVLVAQRGNTAYAGRGCDNLPPLDDEPPVPRCALGGADRLVTLIHPPDAFSTAVVLNHSCSPLAIRAAAVHCNATLYVDDCAPMPWSVFSEGHPLRLESGALQPVPLNATTAVHLFLQPHLQLRASDNSTLTVQIACTDNAHFFRAGAINCTRDYTRFQLWPAP
jgi:hypothetical protein